MILSIEVTKSGWLIFVIVSLFRCKANFQYFCDLEWMFWILFTRTSFYINREMKFVWNVGSMMQKWEFIHFPKLSFRIFSPEAGFLTILLYCREIIVWLKCKNQGGFCFVFWVGLFSSRKPNILGLRAPEDYRLTFWLDLSVSRDQKPFESFFFTKKKTF